MSTVNGSCDDGLVLLTKDPVNDGDIRPPTIDLHTCSVQSRVVTAE